MPQNPQGWDAAFSIALGRAVSPAVVALFQPDGFWRDLLAFTRNIESMEGRAEMATMREATLPTAAPSDRVMTGAPETEGQATAVEALWLHSGNLALSRFYSRFVTLQLKARIEGIATPVWDRPAPVQQGEGA